MQNDINVIRAYIANNAQTLYYDVCAPSPQGVTVHERHNIILPDDIDLIPFFKLMNVDFTKHAHTHTHTRLCHSKPKSKLKKDRRTDESTVSQRGTYSNFATTVK